MGHSVGEYVAACIAGVFSLEDGLMLIATRARLMGSLPANSGTMAAIFASKDKVEAAIAAHSDVSLAACNGPTSSHCLRCDSLGVNAYLKNGQCVLSCGDGFYADDARVCHPCHSTCRQCTGPRSNECLSCTSHPCSRSKCPASIHAILDGTRCVSSCEHSITFINHNGIVMVASFDTLGFLGAAAGGRAWPLPAALLTNTILSA